MGIECMALLHCRTYGVILGIERKALLRSKLSHSGVILGIECKTLLHGSPLKSVNIMGVERIGRSNRPNMGAKARVGTIPPLLLTPPPLYF